MTRREGQRRLRVEHGKIVEHPPRERQIAGKISHWGKVGKRSHILTAKVPDDFVLGEKFIVTVLAVPNCDLDNCGKDGNAKSKSR